MRIGLGMSILATRGRRSTVEITAPPSITGSGKVGDAHALDVGSATGDGAVSVVNTRLLRNGQELVVSPGASYVPTASDDLGALTLEVTWQDDNGTLRSGSAPVPVTHHAPTVIGTLDDQLWTVGQPTPVVDVTQAFSGENLSFSFSDESGALPAGFTMVDGIIASGTPADAAPGRMLTVDVGNSGGTVQASFSVAVQEPATSVFYDVVADFEASQPSVSFKVTEPDDVDWALHSTDASPGAGNGDIANGTITAPPSQNFPFTLSLGGYSFADAYLHFIHPNGDVLSFGPITSSGAVVVVDAIFSGAESYAVNGNTHADFAAMFGSADADFSRSTAGLYRLSNGNFTEHSAGQPRHGDRGLLVEVGAQNLMWPLKMAGSTGNWAASGGSAAATALTAFGVFPGMTCTATAGEHGRMRSVADPTLDAGTTYRVAALLRDVDSGRWRISIVGTGTTLLRGAIGAGAESNGGAGTLANLTETVTAEGVFISFEFTPAVTEAYDLGFGPDAVATTNLLAFMIKPGVDYVEPILSVSGALATEADAPRFNIPDGSYDVEYTFENDATQTFTGVTVAGGAGYTVPAASLDQRYVKRLRITTAA